MKPCLGSETRLSGPNRYSHCSGEEEAEDVLDAEGEAECHEALTALNYPGKRKLHLEILLH